MDSKDKSKDKEATKESLKEPEQSNTKARQESKQASTGGKEKNSKQFDMANITDDMYEDLYGKPTDNNAGNEDFMLFKGSTKPLPPPKAGNQEQDDRAGASSKKDTLAYFSDIANKRPQPAEVRHFQPKSKHDIPLINFRMLFFHYCTRDGPTNKLASMRHGQLILQ